MKDFELLPNEKIIKTTKGDCWATPQLITKQVPGKFIFTNQRIIFIGSGLIEKLRMRFEIPYDEISSIEPYLVLFFKTGIRIWLKDNDDGYRISVKKREEYMNIINTYI